MVLYSLEYICIFNRRCGRLVIVDRRYYTGKGILGYAIPLMAVACAIVSPFFALNWLANKLRDKFS